MKYKSIYRGTTDILKHNIKIMQGSFLSEMGRAMFAGHLHVHFLPVGGTVELRVNAWLIHNCPCCRGDEELLVDTVS